VTGNTAQSVDQNALLKSKAPIVFGFVLIFAFGLLLVAFRSIVIALKAIALNLLSVAAAYGVLVLVFQYGWGESLFDFSSNGGIAYWLPIFLFVILFGLSMDYHIFILTRVREAYDRGLSTQEAVEYGISATAGVVTSAALVMVGVFACFALMPILDMKEMASASGGGGPHRRDDRAGRPAPGFDEAARRLELVPAELARVATAPGAGRAGGTGRDADCSGPADKLGEFHLTTGAPLYGARPSILRVGVVFSPSLH
jgi:hypothetical protein